MQKILLQNSTTCSVIVLLRTAVGGTETLSFVEHGMLNKVLSLVTFLPTLRLPIIQN